jgi:hypothetical protein
VDDKLSKFNESVLRISAPAISAFGSKLPGMAGKSAAEQGAMTPAADVIYKLKRQVADLNRKMAGHPKDRARIKKAADDIESSLLSLQTLSVIDEKRTVNLISQLHKLTANG